MRMHKQVLWRLQNRKKLLNESWIWWPWMTVLYTGRLTRRNRRDYIARQVIPGHRAYVTRTQKHAVDAYMAHLHVKVKQCFELTWKPAELKPWCVLFIGAINGPSWSICQVIHFANLWPETWMTVCHLNVVLLNTRDRNQQLSASDSSTKRIRVLSYVGNLFGRSLSSVSRYFEKNNIITALLPRVEFPTDLPIDFLIITIYRLECFCVVHRSYLEPTYSLFKQRTKLTARSLC